MTIDDEKVVASAATAPPSAPVGVEAFVVREYIGDDGPSIKGNGFDGLRIGEDRYEAEEFIRWINARLAQQPTAVDGARPVEVTDSMVKAACGAYVRNPRNDAERAKPGAFHDPSEHLQWHCRRMSRDRFEQFMRAALTAALAAQSGGSDNDQ